MTRSLEILLILVLLVGVVLALGATPQRARVFPRGSVQNERPDGASSLLHNLQQWGHSVRVSSQSPLSLTPFEDSVLLVLSPNTEFTDWEIVNLRTWVEFGGTLVVAQDARKSSRLLDHYQVRVAPMWAPVRRAPLRLPALNFPLVGEAEIRASHKLTLDRDDGAIHMGDCDVPFLAAFGVGEGQVIVMSTAYPFTNEGLQAGSNAQLVSNLVRAAAWSDGYVVLDEAHHQEISGGLASSVAGLIYVAGVFIVVLALNLRPFGKLVRPIEGSARSAPSETMYSRRMAADFVSHVGWQPILRSHYWERLKRSLAREHHLDPTLPDVAFVEELAYHRSEEDVAALIGLLSELDREQESSLAAAQWVRTIIAWQESADAQKPIDPHVFGRR